MAYAFHPVLPDEIAATDLRAEYAQARANGHAATTYRVTLEGHAEQADVLYVIEAGRIGIAWGAPADWFDAHTAGSGIAAWVAGLSPTEEED